METPIPTVQEQFDAIESTGEWPSVFHRLRLHSDIYRELETEEARHPRNRDFNRYRDVSPYDHTRVKLDNCGPKNKRGYINGSFVEVPQAGRKYILAQGPLPSTIGHFWLMVWQQNSRAVVMLNRVIEKNTIKCSLYWPDGEKNSHSDEIDCEDVRLKVRLEKEVNKNYFIERVFSVQHMDTNETKEVSLTVNLQSKLFFIIFEVYFHVF